MSNIIKFPQDKHTNITYIMNDVNEPAAIRVKKGGIAAEFWLDGELRLDISSKMEMTADEMKMLMIMWLSMVDPGVINYDAKSLK